ncbi:CynX/NimT family MFS transporter [Limosilactobacillus caccae]|uniref:CynX/NimT family MFS transporter n=1 Tax=Limosilactobacillus caccae TaxID=1926284 RepID=UPI0009704916|nr:MFS transporter [Limosilactobacillus caccae]
MNFLEKLKKHSPFLILGLLLLGVCMRMPITAIPSVIKEIASTLHVEPTSLGILTTIPLLCFGLLSSLVSTIAQRIGNELTIELAMILMFIGSYLRILNLTSLMVGTILVGAAITCINVLLPAIISDKLPDRIGSVTGMYNVAMTLFAAIGAYVITPITHATSWETAVIIISIIALIAAIIWVPNLKYNQRANSSDQPADRGTNMWKNANAWWLLLFFGGQCFVFYSIVAWLPTIAMDAGLTSDQASLAAGLLQLFSMPFAFLVPVIATKMNNRQPIMLFAGIVTLIGAGMMFFPVNSFAYYAIVALFLGMGTTTTFVLAMTLFGLKTKSAADTRNLSGMVQSVGYLIAALGPVVVGNLYSSTHNWFASLIVIVIATIFFAVCGVIAERKQFV